MFTLRGPVLDCSACSHADLFAVKEQMTEKLYYEDAYMTEFDSVVTEVILKENSCKAAFAQTAFYPEGGGQPADAGEITLQDGKCIKVSDVHEKDGIIWHTLSEAVEVGAAVHGCIDRERRFDHMQQHSGEHIVSGMICSRFNCDNVGFHMGEDSVTIDFNARISWEEALEIEEQANRYIWENHEFVQMWPDAAELAALNYRSKKELTGAVRIASFPGADMCACCGTHVARSGEVGLVKFASAHNFHEGTRMELYCGKRALDFLSESFRANKQVAVMLSTKEDKTPQVVEKQMQDYIQLKGSLQAIEDDYFRLWTDSLKGEDNVLIISDTLNPEQGRRLAEMLAAAREGCGATEEITGLAAVFTRGGGTEGGASVYRYALISKCCSIDAFVKKMNGSLSGRGGGRNGFAQGTVTASEEAVREFWKEVF